MKKSLDEGEGILSRWSDMCNALKGKRKERKAREGEGKGGEGRGGERSGGEGRGGER
jgi:hypothetical protein